MRSRRRASISKSELGTRDGREALDYAERRGLSPRRMKEFRIGFAPNAKDALKAALIKRGFSEAQLLDAGLLIKPDDGRAPYDRFRHRLTIPILNAKAASSPSAPARSMPRPSRNI